MKNLYLFFFVTLGTIHVQAQQWLGSNVVSGIGASNPSHIVSDDLQNSYVCGVFTKTIEHSQISETSRGQNDIYVVRYDSENEEKWFRTIGGSGLESSPQIAFSNNNVIVAGTFSTQCYFGETDYIESQNGYDIFIAKYNATDGTLLWRKNVVWGNNNQVITTLHVDENNNIIIAGYTNNDAYFTDDTFIDFTAGRTSFIAKFDANGNYIWHTSVVHTATGSITGITSFSDTYYLAGTTQDNATFVDIQNIQTPLSSVSTKNYFYVAALSNNGILQWAKTSAGNSTASTGDESYTISHNSENLYVAGFYTSTNLSFDNTSLNITNKGSQDIFLLALSLSGEVNYCTSVSSDKQDLLYGIKIDRDVLYLAGSVGGEVTFNQETIIPPVNQTAMFIAAYILNANSLTEIGAVEGIQGVGKGVVTSPKSFKITGTYNSAELILDQTYYNGATPPANQMFLAEACPIVGINKTITPVEPANLCGSSTIAIDVLGIPFSAYTLQWGDKNGLMQGQTAATLTDVDPGTYTATIAYSAGQCSKSYDIIIPAHTVEVTGIQVVDIPCANIGESIGQITVEVDYTGDQDIEYSIPALSITQTNDNVFTDLPAGDYTIIVKFADSECPQEINATIDLVNTDATLDINVDNDNTCNERNTSENDGSITVSTTVAQNRFELINYKNQTVVAFVEFEDGFELDEYTFTGIAAGKYFAKAINNNESCVTMKSAVVEVMQPAPIVITSALPADVLCSGNNTGTITAKAAGADFMTFVLIDEEGNEIIQEDVNNDGREVFTGLNAGIYSLVVKTTDGCSATFTNIIIKDRYEPLQLNIVNQQNSCYGVNSGLITLSAIGGALPGNTTPYTFTLTAAGYNSSNITGQYTGLAPGEYTATVLSQLTSCSLTLTETIQIIGLDPVEFSDPIAENVKCNGGNTGVITVASITGGNESYIVTLAKEGSPVAVLYEAPYVFEGLYAGAYTVTVADNIGCSVAVPVKNAVISEPDILAITVVEGENTDKTIECYGDNSGMILAAATGGLIAQSYTYTLYKEGEIVGQPNASGHFTSLFAGVYIVKVTDDNGCEASTVPITIVQNDKMKITLDKVNVKCFGESNGSIEVNKIDNGAAPYTYILRNSNNGGMEPSSASATLFLNLPADIYRLNVIDKNGCSVDSSNIVITQPAAIVASAIQSKLVSCSPGNDGAITVTASGGSGNFEYKIDDEAFVANNIFNNLSAGTYTITVKDVISGCTVEVGTIIVEIIQPDAIIAAAVQSKLVSCAPGNDGTITVMASGGSGSFEYKIDDEAFVTNNIFNNLSAGTYTITVKDVPSGCTVETETTIRTANPPALVLQAGNAACFGGLGTIVATATAEDDQDTPGSIVSYSIDPNEGTSYSDLTPGIFGNLAIGSYSISVMDNYGCVSTEEVTIEGPAEAISLVVVSYTDVTASAKGSIVVQPNGGWQQYTITCYLGDVVISSQEGDDLKSYTFTNLEKGEYTIVAVDAAGCTVEITQTISEPQAPVTGNSEIDAASLKVYPNPSTDGRFFIEWNTQKDQKVTVEVFNMSGQEVYKTNVQTGAGGARTSLDISSHSRGSYILRVPELNIQHKIVIQ